MLVIGYVLIVYLIIFVIICVLMIFILCLYYKDENKEIFLMFKKMYNVLICVICKKKFIVVDVLSIELENLEEFDK